MAVNLPGSGFGSWHSVAERRHFAQLLTLPSTAGGGAVTSINSLDCPVPRRLNPTPTNSHICYCSSLTADMPLAMKARWI
ncbi:hypothetical protein E2562_014760 [Oryza meyeriana var. granulata]|uniref:Uncharacterized protein n=1 Tax=Oryza meyeriana var. granulata TaxID=110450 RepID=A0A6G1BMB1_9ORYZ|nr:hypothetical protein E2562_014760 [Oryza meyeriana var. granulata]